MDSSCHSSVSRVFLYIIAVVVHVFGEDTPIRKPEKLFSNSTLLMGRKVTCDNVRPSSGKFAADTWTCYNMRVEGLHVRYWYIPGFGADTGCSDGKARYDSRNDLAQLCKHMMKVHYIDKELWVAYVNKASCAQSPDKRVIFALKGGTFQWETVFQGNGYIMTLRCMTVD